MEERGAASNSSGESTISQGRKARRSAAKVMDKVESDCCAFLVEFPHHSLRDSGFLPGFCGQVFCCTKAWGESQTAAEGSERCSAYGDERRGKYSV